MSNIRFAAIAALTLFLSVPAFAATQNLKVVSFTGEVQIKIGDKMIGFVPGTPLPEIPPGAEIKVVSGDAVFSSAGTAVNASAGSAFSYNVTTDKGATTVSIAAAADSRPVTVASGGYSAVVGGGSAVNVARSASGAVTMTAAAGSLALTMPDGSVARVTAGESVLLAKAPEQDKQETKTEEKTEDKTKGSDTGTPAPPQTLLQDEVTEEEENVVSPSAP